MRYSAAHGKLSIEVPHICFVLQYQVRPNEDGFRASIANTCFWNNAGENVNAQESGGSLKAMLMYLSGMSGNSV